MIEYKIYGLKDPQDNIIKYVGVSKNVQSRYKQHLYSKKGEKSNWIKSLLELDLRPELVILDTIITNDRNVALNKEKEYIKEYKDTLYNITFTQDMNGGVIIEISNEVKDELDFIKKDNKYTKYDDIITMLIINYYKNKSNEQR